MRTPSRLVLAALAVVLAAGVSAPRAGAQSGASSAFSVLQLEPSARAAALGGSFSAVYGDDVNGLFYNPALLHADVGGALALSYLNHVSDLRGGFLAYAHDLPGVATLGGGVRYFGWGEMERADETGASLGTFGASSLALTVAAARPYGERLQAGVAVHAVTSSIDADRATALAADVGVLYRLPDQAVTVSASVNHLGTTLSSLGTTRDELPLDVRVGVTKRLRYVPLLVTVTGYNLHEVGEAPVDDTDRGSAGVAVQHVLQHLALGGEFQFSESFNVRVGYNHRRHEALKTKARLDLAGFAVGFGVNTSRIGVDYAYNTWSAAGGLHQVTLRTSF